nr:cobalt transporter [Pseudanabaena sp. PCC 7367]
MSIASPTAVFAHVGHGDEFQATGGINRVEVNAETDSFLGIEVKPIEPATDGSSAVFIPATAIVDVDGQQFVFVEYENFYEPVEISTGETQGELIEVLQELSVGERLVTQGSLSLYAESRKTQTTDSVVATDGEEIMNDSVPTPVETEITENDITQDGLGRGLIAVGVGGAVLLIGAGAIVVFTSGKKNNPARNNREL